MQIKEDYYYPTIESFYFPTSTFNHFWDAVDAFSKVYIIDDFIRKVKPEGPWDIKLRDAWEATIGTKFPGQNTTVIYHKDRGRFSVLTRFKDRGRFSVLTET